MIGDDIDAISGEQQPIVDEVTASDFNPFQGWPLLVTLPGCFLIGLALYFVVR